MEHFGPTIRAIRLDKGFTQKEIYTGIISKSFAVEFEKGTYDVKFHLMLKILERLMISVEELLLLHHAPIPSHDPLREIDLEKLQHDADYAHRALSCARQEAAASNSRSSKLNYMELLALTNLYAPPDRRRSEDYQAAKRFIQRYLFDIETWTLAEVRIFSDMSFLFDDGDVKTSLFLTAWKSLETYRQHPDFPLYLSHLLVNNLYRLLYTGQYQTAEKAIDRLSDLTQGAHMLSWKVPLLYYTGLLRYVKGDQKAGLELVEKARTIYLLSGHNFMAEQMENGLLALQRRTPGRAADNFSPFRKY